MKIVLGIRRRQENFCFDNVENKVGRLVIKKYSKALCQYSSDWAQVVNEIS